MTDQKKTKNRHRVRDAFFGFVDCYRTAERMRQESYRKYPHLL